MPPGAAFSSANCRSRQADGAPYLPYPAVRRAWGVCVKASAAGHHRQSCFSGASWAPSWAPWPDSGRPEPAPTVPRLHSAQGLAGVTALSLWFYTIGRLPLSTAVTL